MRMTLILIALGLLSGCAHNDPWTEDDTRAFTMYAVAGAADTYTTSRFQYYDSIEEKNPVVVWAAGENPKTSDLWQMYATVAATNWLVMRALPAEWRRKYIGVWTGAHGSLAISNAIQLHNTPKVTQEPLVINPIVMK